MATILTQPWASRKVPVFAGQHDTNIKTGADYNTLSLGEIFKLDVGKADKSRSRAIIPSTYNQHDARCHARQREAGQFVALCADIDTGDHSKDEVRSVSLGVSAGFASVIYSSAHARPGDMRWRVVLPLAEPLAFDDWHDAQLGLFALFQREGITVDGSLGRAGQPVYLPNVPAVHSKSGERLRSDNGEPLYFHRSSTGWNAPGLDPHRGAIANEVAVIRRQRVRDEQERARIREQAEIRRASRPKTASGPIIEQFNRDNDLVTLLQSYGYEQSPRHGEDWRSPLQSSDSYATRIIGDKWVSLSASDAGAGVGERCKSGCYGDAYDLFAHFEHDGDHRSAFRQLYSERRVAMAYEKFGRPAPIGEVF